MPFPTALSAPQKATLRTSGYWQRTFIAFNPGEIVFQAEANEDITDAPFDEFIWTNATTGAFADALPGMVVYISDTTAYQKDFKYRGRVRKTANASIFYIDLNATTLEAGDIITVIRDADLFAKIRNDTFIDSDVAYHNLPPMITGFPSVLPLYDSDDDGVVSYTTVQSGIAVASGATISAWLHTISGAGTITFTSGTSTSQNPTVELEAGYHYLWRCRVTDSNGVQHFVYCQVYAVDRTFSAPVILQAAAGSVSQDLESGYTGSITAYGGVGDLPYRTHAVIFCVEHFGDNSSTPMVTNVLMHGRLRSESIITEGSAEAGQLQTVTYPIEGITSYMQRLKVPNDMVRHNAAPNEWGEMVNPTPYRMAVYFLYAYSTLLNLVSFSAGDSLFDAWRIGGEPVSIDGGYALDTLNSLMERIKASANYAPDGEIRNEIIASYKVVRSGLVTIMDFLPQDSLSVTLDIDTSRNTAQVVGFGGVWNTVNNTFILYTAQSPSIPYGDAPEVRELNRELLQYDSTTAQATTELAARTGNDYAANNPKWLLNVTMWDAHRWLVATSYQRYTWTLAATFNLREIAITTAMKWQCQSMNITINADGTYDVGAQFVQETEFTDAQSIASLLPANLEGMNPTFPALSDDLAFPDNPLWMFPTDNPTLEELPAIDPYSAMMGFTPLPPDQAAAAAAKQGTTKCKTFQVLMRNSGTTNSPFLTVNTAPYTLEISGSGRISNDAWHSHRNLVTSQDSFSIDPLFGAWALGTGFTPTDGEVTPGVFIRSLVVTRVITSTTLTRVRITFDLTKGSYSAVTPVAIIFINGAPVASVNPADITDGANKTLEWSGSSAAATFISVQIVTSYQGSAVYSGAATLTSMTVDGTGTDGFTGNPGTSQDGDAFYRYLVDDEASVELFEPTAGLLIDGAKPAIIPDFNPSHEYIVPFTGTGNAIQGNYALSDYTDVANRAITIRACRD